MPINGLKLKRQTIKYMSEVPSRKLSTLKLELKTQHIRQEGSKMPTNIRETEVQCETRATAAHRWE